MMSKWLLLGFGLSLLLCSTSTAQVNDDIRQQRRELIGGLLRTLIESQLDDNDLPQAFPPGRQPVRPGIPVAATRELQQIRQSLANFSLQTDDLVRRLQQLQFDSPQARALLADAMQVKAQTDALASFANRISDHRDIEREFKKLDQNWRILAHRVRQSPGIDAGCIACVDQIQALGNEMCTCLGVQPTLNRAELVRLTSALNLSFRHLLQDLYFDNRNEQRIAKLVEEGQELLTKFNQASAAIEREPYDTIAAVYQDSVKDWRKFVRKIRPFQTERIRRNIEEIESIGRSIHDQLWLTVQLDVGHILDVTRGIQSDVDRLFQTITLDDLLACENPGVVMNSAREFRRRCETFAQSLENGLESWVWDYQLFNVQWQSLLQQCRPIQQPRVIRRLDNIDDSMMSLNQMMGQGPAITRDELIQLTAQLDQLSTEIRLTAAQNVLQDRNYDRVFRTEFDNRSRRLHDSIHECHQTLVMGRRQNNLDNDLRNIFDHWTGLKQLINQCTDEDRAAFHRFRREMEPLMVKLQVIFST